MSSRSVAVLILAAAFGPSAARAQSAGGFLPVGAGGGFVPYRGGPSDGFGMPSRPADPAPAGMTSGSSFRMSPALGAPRAAFPTLGPLGLTRGRGMGVGMGSAGARRNPSRPMRRAPVGAYPFRLPPSLFGPATGGPMGM